MLNKQIDKANILVLFKKIFYGKPQGKRPAKTGNASSI